MMTKLHDIKFLSGLNFQHDHRLSTMSDRYPKVGVLIITFILAFVGSFKMLARVDNQTTTVSSNESSDYLTYNSSQPEVLALDVQNKETHIDSLEVKTSTGTTTPTLVSTITTTPTSTLTPTPSPVPSPTPSSVPQPMYSDFEVMGFIDRFGSQYGIDPNVLRHIATCESGFNQQAKNGPYVGLFQFGTSAWVTGRAKMGEDANLDLRLNAEESIQTAAYLLAEGRTDLWPHCIP